MHDLATVASIGTLIAVSVLIGLAFGHWLDSKLHSGSWCTFIFILFGLAAGIYESAKILLETISDDDSK